MAANPVTEAEKRRRVPGILFADGPTGRRARIAGTGLDVFEIIKAYRTCGEDRSALADAFGQLTPLQIQAAFDYYHSFPDEIDARLEREAAITPEYIQARHAPRRPQSRTGLR